MVWWLPLAGTHLDPRDGQLGPRNVGFSGRITKDDIELTRWMEQQLPDRNGLIGVANMPFMIGEAKFLFPIDAAQSLSLYGKKYNFTFQVFDPGRQYGYSDYLERIVNYFDADWCLKNNIRYFHVPLTDRLSQSWPGARAADRSSQARQVRLVVGGLRGSTDAADADRGAGSITAYQFQPGALGS